MSTFDDRTLARRMLEARQVGYTFGLFYRRSATRYLFLVTVSIAGLGVLALNQFWIPFWVVLGMFIGTVIRDIGWVISIRRTWPFSERVTDWEKVQALADESARA